jgi:hypothetical protein
MGRGTEQYFALLQGLAHELEMQRLKVAQAAVDQFRAG